MRIPRIYTTQSLAENQKVQLEEKPSHHLSRVLRLSEGAELILFNGEGGQYQAVIERVEKKHIQILTRDFDRINRESKLQIHLGIAISKGDRMDQVMQKATELGVSRITPLYSSRSQIKLKGDRAEKKLQHWQQIIIGACEQCQRNIVPLLNPIINITDWINQSDEQQKFVLHHRSNKRLDSHINIQSIALLIGPEGGLNSSEILYAEENDFQPLTLGPRVLRTETAPLAAVTLLQYLWGDL